MLLVYYVPPRVAAAPATSNLSAGTEGPNDVPGLEPGRALGRELCAFQRIPSQLRPGTVGDGLGDSCADRFPLPWALEEACRQTLLYGWQYASYDAIGTMLHSRTEGRRAEGVRRRHGG